MRKLSIAATLLIALTGCGTMPTLATAAAQRSASATTATPQERAKARFDRIDADKNGAISFEEFQTGKEGRGPGFGGPRPGFGHPGFGGPRPGHGPMGFGLGADADKDGKVTLDEFKAAKGPGGQAIPADKVQELFDRLDTNKDGAVSKDDLPARGPKPAAK